MDFTPQRTGAAPVDNFYILKAGENGFVKKTGKLMQGIFRALSAYVKTQRCAFAGSVHYRRSGKRLVGRACGNHHVRHLCPQGNAAHVQTYTTAAFVDIGYDAVLAERRVQDTLPDDRFVARGEKRLPALGLFFWHKRCPKA